MTLTIKDQQISLVLVAGTGDEGFDMGGESWNKDSLPIHKVRLSPYFIGQFPVTQALWEAVIDNNPSFYIGNKNRPVENVSHIDILGEEGDGKDVACFMFQLNQLIRENPENVAKLAKAAEDMGKANLNFDLPTEAQWEYAARGGKEGCKQKDFVYSGATKENLHEVAWYEENSHRETKPVGLKKPNGLGIYDMTGNVWEWCRDWYDSKYYEKCNTLPAPPSTQKILKRARTVCNVAVAGAAMLTMLVLRIATTIRLRFGTPVLASAFVLLSLYAVAFPSHF